MIPYPRAVFAAGIAEVLLAFLFETFFQALARLTICIPAFCSGWCNVLAFLIVNVSPHFEIEICFARGGDTVGDGVRLARCYRAIRRGLMGL